MFQDPPAQPPPHPPTAQHEIGGFKHYLSLFGGEISWAITLHGASFFYLIEYLALYLVDNPVNEGVK